MSEIFLLQCKERKKEPRMDTNEREQKRLTAAPKFSGVKWAQINADKDASAALHGWRSLRPRNGGSAPQRHDGITEETPYAPPKNVVL